MAGFGSARVKGFFWESEVLFKLRYLIGPGMNLGSVEPFSMGCQRYELLIGHVMALVPTGDDYEAVGA